MVDTNNSNSGLKCKEEVGQREIFKTYSLEEKEHGEANYVAGKECADRSGATVVKGISTTKERPCTRAIRRLLS